MTTIQDNNDFVPESLKNFIAQAEETLAIATQESSMNPDVQTELEKNISMISVVNGDEGDDVEHVDISMMMSVMNGEGHDEQVVEMTEDDDDRRLKEEIMGKFCDDDDNDDHSNHNNTTIREQTAAEPGPLSPQIESNCIDVSTEASSPARRSNNNQVQEHHHSRPPRRQQQQRIYSISLEHHPLANKLHDASSVLVDRLFEYLSTCPPPPQSDEENVDCGSIERQQQHQQRQQQQRNNHSHAARGLTLPASAIGWLSSQIYPMEEDDVGSVRHYEQHNNINNREDISMMESSMRDRLSLLKFLLQRVTHLRITSDQWPLSSKKTRRNKKKKKRGTTRRAEPNNNYQRGATIDSRTNVPVTPEQDVSFTAVSVQSALTTTMLDESMTHDNGDGNNVDVGASPTTTRDDEEDGSDEDEFLLYYDSLQHRPRIDLRMFPNLSVLLLNRIPPEWIHNIWYLQSKLELLRFEHACIYDMTSFLFGSNDSNNNNGTDPLLLETDMNPAVSLLEENYFTMEPSYQVYSNLTHLKLTNCSIGELSGLLGRGDDLDSIDYVPPPLSRLPNLVSLSLAHNELMNTKSALAGLACLPMLTKLDLSYNKLSSMDEAFMMLGNITVLVLTGNRIRNVRGLDRLYALEQLFLDQNLIKDVPDVAGLGQLPYLTELDLQMNPLAKKNPKRYRVDILNLFKQSRFASLPRNATYRQLLEILPILDGKAASKKELYGLRLLTFNQSVTYMDNNDVGFVVVDGITPSNARSVTNISGTTGEIITSEGEYNIQNVSLSTRTVTQNRSNRRITRVKKSQKATIEDRSGVSAFTRTSTKRKKKKKKKKEKKPAVSASISGSFGFASVDASKSSCFIGDLAAFNENDDSTKGSIDFSLKDVISTLSPAKPTDNNKTYINNKGGLLSPPPPDDRVVVVEEEIQRLERKLTDVHSNKEMLNGGKISPKKTERFDLEVSVVPKKRAPVRSSGLMIDTLQQKKREASKSNTSNEWENEIVNDSTPTRKQHRRDDLSNQSFGSSGWEKALEANFNKNSKIASGTDDLVKSAVSSISGVESDQSPHHSRNNSLTLDLKAEPVTTLNEAAFPDLWGDNSQPSIQNGSNFHIWEDDDCSSAQSNPLGMNMEDFPEEAKFLKEEEDSVYDGPESYGGLNLRVNMGLYFRSFVFPPPRNSQMVQQKTSFDEMEKEDKSSLLLNAMPRIQLCAVDHDDILQNKPDLLSYRESFRHLWSEEVVACGKLATSRLRPNRSPKRGFHGDIMFTEGKLDTTSECRRVLLCTSDSALYIISDYDAVTVQAQRKSVSNKRKFPLPIPKDSLFQHAVWPHAVARHPIEMLHRITIGFGFQRLTLHFKASPSLSKKNSPRNDEFAYIIILSNKMRTVSLLQQLQDHVKECTSSHNLDEDSTSLIIENDDKKVLDSLAAAVSPNVLGVVLHYQILQQRWKHGDRGAVRRICVVTDTKMYLLDEDYVGDGSSVGTHGEEESIMVATSPSSSHANTSSPSSIASTITPLGDVKFAMVDFAELTQIDEVHAADADPRSITIIIRPSSSFLRPHRWRLHCRDGDAAEKLVDDVRKAIEQFE